MTWSTYKIHCQRMQGWKQNAFAKCCRQFIQGVREEKYCFVRVPDDYRWQMMTNDDQWWLMTYEPLNRFSGWTHTHRTCGNSWYATWYRLIAPSCENGSSGGSNPLVSDQPVWGTCNQGFQINMCFKDYRYSCLQSRTPQLFCCYESQELSFIDHNKDTVTIILSSSFLMHITAVINHQVSIPSSAWNH